MATRREPRFKLCRRLGINICGHPKALDRGTKVGRGKISEYGKQLMEKQKIKAYYGILERQFARYMQKSEKSKEVTGTALLTMLECRLDNLVYRLGFGRSIRQARQFVSHGHIMVNGSKVNIPSYEVKVNDVISVRESLKNNDKVLNNLNGGTFLNLAYLERDTQKMTGRLARKPGRLEIPVEVNEILAVELYSK